LFPCVFGRFSPRLPKIAAFLYSLDKWPEMASFAPRFDSKSVKRLSNDSCFVHVWPLSSKEECTNPKGIHPRPPLGWEI
jgi:hypothetical protein